MHVNDASTPPESERASKECNAMSAKLGTRVRRSVHWRSACGVFVQGISRRRGPVMGDHKPTHTGEVGR
jgi:hypothetical protein